MTSLELVIRYFDYLPCAKLWECWQNVDELEISGEFITLTKNYDAKFCGISEEEAEVLRGMNEEYLRT